MRAGGVAGPHSLCHTMTSRERVRAVLRRERPDRLPNGLGATLNTGLHVLAYRKLRALLGLPERPPHIMSFEVNALFDSDVLEALDVDMVSLGVKLNPARFRVPGAEEDWKLVELWGAPFLLPRAWELVHDPDGTVWIDGLAWDTIDFNVLLDRPGCRLKCPAGGFYFDPTPLPGSMPVENPPPEDYRPPHDYPDEWLRRLEESARWLHENTDYAIVCDEMINDFQLSPGGLPAWWMRMVSEPDIVHEFLSRACDAAVSQLKLVDQAVGRYAEMLVIAQDFGDLRGVTMGPDLWREIYKPHFRRLFGEWHRITPMKICMHSCGSIAAILRDLEECGLEVINPVQVSAAGMDPVSLKERFGSKLVFYGGSFDAVALPPETPEEVVFESVRSNIRALSRGGGYIFSGVHNIQCNVPDSHLRAIMDAFRSCRDEAGL